MLSLIGMLFCAASAGPSAVPVHLEISSPAPRQTLGVITVHARPLASSGTQEPRAEQVARLDVRTGSVNLAPGYWSLRAETPGAWGASAEVEVPHVGAPVVLRLWPTGRLSGQLATGSEPAPNTFTLVFQSPPSERAKAKEFAVPKAEVECPVARGAWSCDVPAGQLDLQLRAKPFVPHYLWDVAVAPKKTTAIGVRALRRGASVAGLVMNEDGTTASTACMVELKSSSGEPIKSPSDPGRAAWTTNLDRRGFFQIAQITPADYMVVASCPTGAFDIAATRLRPDSEFVPPRPLTLRQPTAVRVEVSPPTDPSDRPWSVAMRRPREPAFKLAPDGEPGRFKGEGLLPGHYNLLVTAGDGRTRSHSEQVELPTPAVIRIDIPSIAVHGSVRLGGEPLKADLHFGGESGFVRVTLQADEEGKFAGVLPRPGPWDVDVDAPSPVVRRALQVDVADNGQEVEIDLPDSRLKGVVEDEAGVRLESMISVQKSDGQEILQTPSEKDGTFEMRGLVPASYKVWAQAHGDPPLESDILPATVEDGRKNPTPLRLVVRRNVVVKAQVVHGTTGVPGAHIVVGSTVPISPMMRSDAEGRFEIFLPPGNRELGLNIGALGYAFRILRTPVPKSGEPLLVPLDRAGGRILLDLSQGTEPYFAVLIHDGYFGSVKFREPWAGANGGGTDGTQVVIPQMEPGAYRACFVRPGELEGLTHRALTSKRCADGTLSPSGELALVLPVPEP